MRAPDQPASASGILRQHWSEGRKLAALPPELRPHDRAEGYAIQAELERHSPKPLFGWKIAATSEAGQRHINVAGPMAGRILAETVLPVGGTASMAGNAMRVAEPEFAFRLGCDLPPRPTPYNVAEVLAAVDTLHPAIEIPDSRFADFVSAGEAQLIADNACAHLFVLGEASTADWRSRDLIAERPRIALRGETFIGHGRNVLGDPLIALAWLVNELSALGVPARAGQVITTGTCHPPLPIDSGDHMEADFGDLGQVSVRFE
ncbi:2-keto-4-pentenoate hydratase [Bradyrhizobium sp. SZCCHNS3002]|uniref:2-keto-4-pentenoate hydratase n=1 Tax=Bradyrhizobium TaxID=374 RepID=UPI0028ED13C8|nr:fumarylacetoacetate hydrolase family protein [Bradyrhizobium sp. SZCCHNS3002]